MQPAGTAIFEQTGHSRLGSPRHVLIDPDREQRLVEFYQARLVAWGYEERNPTVSRRLAQLLARLFAGAASRGILLNGAPGTGKTVGLTLVCEYMGSRWWNAETLNDMGKSVTDVADYGGPGGPYTWQRPQDVYVDDLGSEEHRVDYGAHINPLTRFLSKRYRLYTERGWFTHVTTNLDTAKLTLRYGERLVSRLNEMCAWVDCGKTDWRLPAAAQKAAERQCQ